MLKVRINEKGRRITIPVPYSILNLGISIISSKKVRSIINEKLQENKKENEIVIEFPELDKRELKQLLKVCREYEGFEIVHVKEKSGTEVSITL